MAPPKISGNRFAGPLFGVTATPVGQGPLRTGILSRPGSVIPVTQFPQGVPVIPRQTVQTVQPTQPILRPGQIPIQRIQPLGPPQQVPPDQGQPTAPPDQMTLPGGEIVVAVAAGQPAPPGRQVSTDAYVMSRLLESVCSHVAQLSDDLYNTAAIQNGAAFALVAGTPSGSHNFNAADMAADGPQSTASPWEAYQNTSQNPVLAVVRVEPFFSQQPPNPLIQENVILLASFDSQSASDPSKAPIVFPSAGVPLSVIVQPNQVLWINVMASGSVKAVLTIVNLRGRRMIFTGE